MGIDVNIPKAKSLQLIIDGNEVNIPIFFSVHKLKFYFNLCTQGKTYRQAFIETVFEMYTSNFSKNGIGTGLTIREFEDADDEQFYNVINFIIEKDKTANRYFEECSTADKYERFYIAYNKIIENIAITAKETFGKLSENIMGITRSIDLYNKQNIAQILAVIPKFDFQLPTALISLQSSISAQQKSITSPIIDKIVMPKFNFEELFSPIKEISAQLQLAIQNSIKPIFNSISALGIERLLANRYLRECNQVFQKFRWWYISDLPASIIDKVVKNPKCYTKLKVDALVCEYYRRNNCRQLKHMIKKWKISNYFSKRKIDLNELQKIHRLKCYNSSVTLSIAIIEGVMRDFIREKIQGYYHFKEVRAEFCKLIESSDKFDIVEYEIINHIIRSVDTIFTGNFKPNSPEQYSDMLRDKRMHGQAYKKQSEANSLKLMLYLNELFEIISVLDTIDFEQRGEVNAQTM